MPFPSNPPLPPNRSHTTHHPTSPLCPRRNRFPERRASHTKNHQLSLRRNPETQGNLFRPPRRRSTFGWQRYPGTLLPLNPTDSSAPHPIPSRPASAASAPSAPNGSLGRERGPPSRLHSDTAGRFPPSTRPAPPRPRLSPPLPARKRRGGSGRGGPRRGRMRRAAGRQGPRGRPTGNGARASRLSGIAALRRPRRGQGAVGRVAAGRGRGWAAGAGGSACALRPGRGAALRPGPALSGGAAPSGRSPPWQVRPAEVRLARLSAGPGRIAGRPSPAGLAPAPRSRPSRALSVCRSRDPAAAAAAEGLPGKQPAPREAGTGTPTPPPPPPHPLPRPGPSRAGCFSPPASPWARRQQVSALRGAPSRPPWGFCCCFSSVGIGSPLEQPSKAQGGVREQAYVV